MPEDLVDELVQLRNALATVKRHAERYVHQSREAASTLDRLTESLSILRELDIYVAEIPDYANTGWGTSFDSPDWAEGLDYWIDGPSDPSP